MNFAELGDALSNELATQPEAIFDQPPASPVPPVVPVEQLAAQTTDEERGRFRLEGADARFARLCKEDVPRDQAYAIAYGAPVAAQPAPSVEPEPEAPTEYEQAQARLAEIEATLDSMVEEAGEVGVTVTPEIRRLQKEERELIRKVASFDALAEVHGERAADEAAYSFEEARASWRDRAEQTFPDLTNPASALFAAVKTRIDALVAANDPLIDSPDVAFLVTASEAANLGVTSQSKIQPGGQPAGRPQASQPRAFAPASGGNASSAHRIEIAPAGQDDQVRQQLTTLVQSGNGNDFAAIGNALSFGDGAPPPRVKIW